MSLDSALKKLGKLMETLNDKTDDTNNLIINTEQKLVDVKAKVEFWSEAIIQPPHTEDVYDLGWCKIDGVWLLAVRCGGSASTALSGASRIVRITAAAELAYFIDEFVEYIKQLIVDIEKTK